MIEMISPVGHEVQRRVDIRVHARNMCGILAVDGLPNGFPDCLRAVEDREIWADYVNGIWPDSPVKTLPPAHRDELELMRQEHPAAADELHASQYSSSELL
jgi:hypothetical protein